MTYKATASSTLALLQGRGHLVHHNRSESRYENGTEGWGQKRSRTPSAGVVGFRITRSLGASLDIASSTPPCHSRRTKLTESIEPGSDVRLIFAQQHSVFVSRVLTQAAIRTQSLPDIEKKRINDAMLRADIQNEVPHSILITVKPSAALATGQAANGKMTTKARADPLSRDFAKYLEDLLLTTTGSSSGACTYKFTRLRKKGNQDGGEFVSASFRVAFAEKAFTNRILKGKLAAHDAMLKKDFNMWLSRVKIPLRVTL